MALVLFQWVLVKKIPFYFYPLHSPHSRPTNLKQKRNLFVRYAIFMFTQYNSLNIKRSFLLYFHSFTCSKSFESVQRLSELTKQGTVESVSGSTWFEIRSSFNKFSPLLTSIMIEICFPFFCISKCPFLFDYDPLRPSSNERVSQAILR